MLCSGTVKKCCDVKGMVDFELQSNEINRDGNLLYGRIFKACQDGIFFL